MINNAKRNSKIYRNTKGNEIRSYSVRDVAKIVYNSALKNLKMVTIIYLEKKKLQ